ncbi:MAG: methylmalonyl-CoA mutase family protein [Planctomycetota bacterium]
MGSDFRGPSSEAPLDPTKTPSGLPVQSCYEPRPIDAERLGKPGCYPFTRGVHADMYRERLWTMRQYAGFGDAQATNERFRYLLAHGQTGLSTAFDLPTQMGYDPDHALAEGEVGKVGVSIATLHDMQLLLHEIPLERASLSMTINATAAILLALTIGVARQRGVPERDLRGTTQNDILKEYVARGTYRFPIRPSLRLVTDVIVYTARHLPNWNPISISGYHMREAGCTAVQEVAFTLAHGIAYVEATLKCGLDVDAFAPRLSFFFAAQNDLFEEVAKFRAARRLWARIMKERFRAQNPDSQKLRFHTQTAGSALAALQPDVNVVRVTLQALAAVLGGTQSLHTNSRDEALALPSADAARLALRTQQVIALESGVTRTVDPLGGCPYVEALTDQIEAEAEALIARIDALGGAIAAIERGFVEREILASARAYQDQVESGELVIVGVNRFAERETLALPAFRVDPSVRDQRVRALEALRARRNGARASAAIAQLAAIAATDQNVMPPLIDAVMAGASLGEICTAFEAAFGKYRAAPVM